MASDKEYEVNWKNHMHHMKGAFESLYDANEFVDVTLYCEGHKIGAHKMVLSACSPYFRNIFKDVPCQHHVIVLNNIEFAIMKNLISFIYHGEVNVHNSKLNLFLQTAQMLKISGLTDARHLKEAANNEVVIEPSEVSAKRKRDSNNSPAEEQQVTKSPRPDPVVPVEVKAAPDELGLMDVKCEPDELVNAFDPLEDPLQHDSSSIDYLQETQYLTEEEQESENMDVPEEVNPNEIEATPSTTDDSVLPSKSKRLYEETYSAYRAWCTKHCIKTTTEEIVLTYFNSDLSTRYRSSTLWTKYSMLRSTINLREGVDISKYTSLISFLKRKGEGFKPKKSLTLTKKQIDEYLLRADDREHLLNKVILIFGVAGACRCQDLVSLTTSCVEDSGSHFLIKVVDPESKKDRSFIVVPGEPENLNILGIIRAYMALRPAKISHNRFFISYAKEKCTVQPVGINRVGSVPTMVARFLNLENPTSYTGHCFRRTSATLVANRPYSTFL